MVRATLDLGGLAGETPPSPPQSGGFGGGGQQAGEGDPGRGWGGEPRPRGW